MGKHVKNERYFKKVKDILTKHEYLKADEIARRCHISNWRVYQIIKRMRLIGIGVIAVRRGYILSEFANHKDDTSFIRRCLGRRSADIIAIDAAKKDILTRWKSIPQGKNNLTPLIYHLSSPDIRIKEKADEGLKFMLTYVNDKGL